METMQAAPPEVKDDDIIRQVLAGDREAFALLIGKYKDSLFDLACRILRNRADAEDVLQDAFLDAYRHLGEFHHQARFSTWVYSIVLNRIRNHLRHKKVIRWISMDAPSTDPDDYKPPELPERGPSSLMTFENTLELKRIQKEVQTLSPLYQSIFILHYFQDVPLQEVAKRMGRPIGTIKVYLHRARKLLYKKLSATSHGQHTKKMAANM